VRIPDADRAIIAPDKLRDYLLNPRHLRGASKAKWLMSFGYRAANWQELAADLRRYHLSRDYDLWEETEYGSRYQIASPVVAPDGREVMLRTIWQIDTGMDRPRLITIIPERKQV
jgi:hypothetical protein